MNSSKASTTCSSTSSACLENKSAVFIKLLPDRVAQYRMYQPLPPITEDLDILEEQLRRERDPKRKPCLHLLVLLKSGQVTSRGQAAAHLALHRNTVAAWLRRYRDGGLEALLTDL